MSAQLEAFLLIKEAMKSAWSMWSIIIFGFDYSLKWPENFWNSSVFSCSEKRGLLHARNCQETEDLIKRRVLPPFKEKCQTGSNQNRKKVGGPSAQLSKNKYILLSSRRDWRLTGAQLVAGTCMEGCWPSRHSREDKVTT